jgi:hypothetical protein
MLGMRKRILKPKSTTTAQKEGNTMSILDQHKWDGKYSVPPEANQFFADGSGQSATLGFLEAQKAKAAAKIAIEKEEGFGLDEDGNSPIALWNSALPRYCDNCRKELSPFRTDCSYCHQPHAF